MRARGGFDRRRFVVGTVALAASSALSASIDEPAAIRIGLTPVFLDDQIGFLAAWRKWLEKMLARPVVFVQRGSYREIVELVRASKIDFAWICGFPYVRHRRELKLVATPLWQGQPLYRSYLIVSTEDRQSRSLADLRDKIFAYSDPDSNSGFLYPQFRLRQMGENPTLFFSRHFFTWAHRKVVEAVAVGLADGGAVDGYVWETLNTLHPALTHQTRIIERSGELGFPPIVARPDIAPAELNGFRNLLLDMHRDAVGGELLQSLRLDGFTVVDAKLYGEIHKMAVQAGLL